MNDERTIMGIPESKIIADYLGTLATNYKINIVTAFSPRSGIVQQARMYKNLEATKEHYIGYSITVTCSSSGKIIASYKLGNLELDKKEVTFYDQNGAEKIRLWIIKTEKAHKMRIREMQAKSYYE